MRTIRYRGCRCRTSWKAVELQTFLISRESLYFICICDDFFTHTLVQRGHFDSILGHAQDHLLVLRHKGKLPILLLEHIKHFLNVPLQCHDFKLAPPVPHLSGVNVRDELQRLLQRLAHAELQLLDGSHILDAELGARFGRAVAFSGEQVEALRQRQGVQGNGRGRGGGGTDWSSWWSLCRGWRRCSIWTALPSWSPLTFQEEAKHSLLLTSGAESQ